jgi:AcrR family transcriptional regulator
MAVPDETGVTDRRVRRTRRALQEAFVALVLERGYDNLSIDDITSRADVARATFYAHYADKEDLLQAVFSALLEDLSKRLTFRTQSQTEVRTEVVEELYRHADEFRDLYRVCLSGAGNGRARDAYFDFLTKTAQRNFSDRIKTLGTTPRVPVIVMARASAGAHIALLQSWLGGEIDMPSEELASMGLHLLVAGFAWGHGISLATIQLASEHDPKDDGSKN